MAVAEVPEPPARIPYQQHCSNCGAVGHRSNRCHEDPRTKPAPLRVLPPRRSKVETELQMLRELSVELTPTDQDPLTLQEARRRLPVVRDTDTVRRPKWRSECLPCPTCQAWRDDGAGWFLGRMPCTHNFDEAVAHSRPCVRVTCRSNLFAEIKPDSGSLTLVFGDVSPADVAGDTCEKDVSARGGMTLEEVGRLFSLTRERIRQCEERGLAKMKAQTGRDLGLPVERGEGYDVRVPRRR